MDFLEHVIEARYYGRYKARYDAATTLEARQLLPQSPLMDLVKVLTFERVQEEIRGGSRDGHD